MMCSLFCCKLCPYNVDLSYPHNVDLSFQSLFICVVVTLCDQEKKPVRICLICIILCMQEAQCLTLTSSFKKLKADGWSQSKCSSYCRIMRSIKLPQSLLNNLLVSVICVLIFSIVLGPRLIHQSCTYCSLEFAIGGSLFLFNKRILRFFRRDGHNWRKKRDGRTVGEAHERLKVRECSLVVSYD